MMPAVGMPVARRPSRHETKYGRVALPVRIYALAKELKLDSKVVVDLCKKAGIAGKGSALASLSDEEAAKLRDFINKPKGGGKPSAAPPAAGETKRPITRDDYIAPTGASGGKVPTIPSRPASKKSAEREKTKPEAEPPREEPPREEPPEKSTIPMTPAAERKPPLVTPTEKPVDESKPEPPPDAPVRPPAPPLPPPKPLKPSKPKPSRLADKGPPSIKLAPLPTAKQPKRADKKPEEPAAQKPDIKLPLDAIRASKAGGKPLKDHLRKHEEKRRAGSEQKGKAAGAGETTDAGAAARERRRPARPGRAGPEEESPKLGGREQRQLKRKKAASERRRRTGDDDTRTPPIRRRRRIRRVGTNTAAPRKSNVVVQLPCTVRSFSEALGIPARDVIRQLMSYGTLANINAEVDEETAELLAEEFDVQVELRPAVDREEQLLAAFEPEEEDPEKLKPRPPIVTFLGHVDHGKTSLLDKIIGTNVVSGETGGITQHIRAYRIETDNGTVAFVDTPGHEAFTEMRARGANVTDIAVLVVAADDGVMPQTEEAISHAKAAGVPLVVALNKIDLPGVTSQRAFEQLAANELLPSEWGGDIEVIKTSATTGQGIDELLETLLTVAELHEYQANPERPATGTCLEAEQHENLGVVAKLIVRSGTLRVGDVVVCGSAYGRVKSMYDTLDQRKRHEAVGPSTPVNLTGLHEAPGAGDTFYVLSDISEARELAERRAHQMRERELAGARPHITLENLYERLGEQEDVQTLNIILRADTRGSIEAIRKELGKLEHPEVQIKILQATVGGITEADVHLADASDAVIIGFSVVPDEGARQLADQRGVQIRRYDIIYQVTEDLKAALEGMLRPDLQQVDVGRALVKQTFQISRVGTIAGCQVLGGLIQRDCRMRVIRDGRVVGDYPLDSLKREKDDAREVRGGLECGIKLRGFNDLKEGDILEAYKVEEVRRTLVMEGAT